MASSISSLFATFLLIAVAHSYPSVPFMRQSRRFSNDGHQQRPNDLQRTLGLKGQHFSHMKAKRDQIQDKSLNVEGSLVISIAPPKLIEARQHGKTVLECSASGSPAPEITWLKDGKPLIKDYHTQGLSDGDFGDFSLAALGETISRISLDCVSEHDAGLYECVAHSSKLRRSVETEVEVVSFKANGCVPRHLMNFQSDPPKIFQWMGTVMQDIGTDARLICRAEGHHHQTVWVGPSENVLSEDNSGKYKILENGDLIIHDLTFAEMGMFKCLVKNKFGDDMQETFVYPTLPEGQDAK